MGSPDNRVTLEQLPAIFRDPFRDDHGRPWTERRMWAQGGKAGVTRICQRYATEDEVARAVGASTKAVRERMRRFGVLKWPRSKREARR